MAPKGHNLDLGQLSNNEMSPVSDRMEGQSPLDQMVTSNEIDLKPIGRDKVDSQSPLNVFEKL